MITQEIVHSALAGEREPMRLVLGALTPLIHARVARVLLRSQIAKRGHVRQHVEDLTQEIFCRLFARDGHALRSWDETRGLSFTSYVELLSEREAVSILRNRKRSPYTESPTEAGELEDELESTDACEHFFLTRQMANALCEKLEHKLTPMGFRVFTLLFIEELSPEDVAHSLATSADAVYAWRSRIRKVARSLADDMAIGEHVP